MSPTFPLLLLDQTYELFSIDGRHISDTGVWQYELINNELPFDPSACEALFIRSNELNGYVGDFLRRAASFPNLRSLAIEGLRNEHVAEEVLKALPQLEKFSVNKISFREPIEHLALQHLEVTGWHSRYLNEATLTNLRVLVVDNITPAMLKQLTNENYPQLEHVGFVFQSEGDKAMELLANWIMPATIKSLSLGHHCRSLASLTSANWRTQIEAIYFPQCYEHEGLSALTQHFDNLATVVIQPAWHIEYDNIGLLSTPVARPIHLTLNHAQLSDYDLKTVIDNGATSALASLNIDLNFLADCDANILAAIECPYSAEHQLATDDWPFERNVQNDWSDEHPFDEGS